LLPPLLLLLLLALLSCALRECSLMRRSCKCPLCLQVERLLERVDAVIYLLDYTKLKTAEEAQVGQVGWCFAPQYIALQDVLLAAARPALLSGFFCNRHCCAACYHIAPLSVWVLPALLCCWCC
jgi:hypothetical protein